MPHTQLFHQRKSFSIIFWKEDGQGTLSLVNAYYAKVRYRFSISVKKLLLMLIVLLRDVQGCALLSNTK